MRERRTPAARLERSNHLLSGAVRSWPRRLIRMILDSAIVRWLAFVQWGRSLGSHSFSGAALSARWETRACAVPSADLSTTAMLPANPRSHAAHVRVHT